MSTHDAPGETPSHFADEILVDAIIEGCYLTLAAAWDTAEVLDEACARPGVLDVEQGFYRWARADLVESIEAATRLRASHVSWWPAISPEVAASMPAITARAVLGSLDDDAQLAAWLAKRASPASPVGEALVTALRDGSTSKRTNDQRADRLLATAHRDGIRTRRAPSKSRALVRIQLKQAEKKALEDALTHALSRPVDQDEAVVLAGVLERLRAAPAVTP